MKLSDYIVTYIEHKNIDTVFGYQGGSIADLIDSLSKSKKIKFVENYNEQASAFSANAYAEISGNVGVAISSSGPGAINLINGIANAYYDSIPCLFITGNVYSKSQKENDSIRQNAFQETNIVELTKSITKKNYYLNNPEDILKVLNEAFYIMNEGRKGPVLIDIPYDIQRAEIENNLLKKDEETNIDKITCDNIVDVIEELKKSKKTVLLVGNGAMAAKEELLKLLEKVKIPTVVSLKALDIVNHDNLSYIGMIGSYGQRCANLAIKHSDLVIILGARLDERQMGYKKDEFAPNAKFIRVDIDKIELQRKVNSDIKINSSVKVFLNELLKYDLSCIDCLDYLEKLKNVKEKYSSISQENSINKFLYDLTKSNNDIEIITSDVGITQMCVAQSVFIKNNQRLLNSAGLGSMGFSLPACIGCAYANKNKKILSISGDGGLQMNIQELQVICRDNLPIFVLCLNNKSLGMIKNLQDAMFNGNYIGSVTGYTTPDFSKIAEAYNLNYLYVNNLNSYDKILDFIAMNHSGFIEVALPQNTVANPMPSKKIYEQLPLIRDIEKELL